MMNVSYTIHNLTTAMSNVTMVTTQDPTAVMNTTLYSSSHGYQDHLGYHGYNTDMGDLFTTDTPDAAFPLGAWRAFEVIHALFTTMALGVNCLSLGIMYGIVMRLTPPLQILSSLGFAEMLAPWAIMTMYFPASACQHQIHSALMLLAHNASALTLLSYALVHSIATYRPLQYERIVTPRRTWITINLVWIVSIVSAHLHFLAVLAHRDRSRTYCDQVQEHLGLPLIMTASILAAAVLVITLTYGRLFLHLRPLEALAGNSTEPRHSTKGVITGVLLVTAFLLGWGPFLIAKLEQVRQQPHLHPNLLIGLMASEVFVLLMCIVHPLMYGVRMTNMYMGYHRLYQRFRGCIVSVWSRARNKGDGDDQPSTPLNPIESIC